VISDSHIQHSKYTAELIYNVSGKEVTPGQCTTEMANQIASRQNWVQIFLIYLWMNNKFR